MALNTYLTADEFEDRFAVANRSNLSNVANVSSSPKTDDRFLAAVSDANEEVDAYVAARFSTAFSTVPAMLKNICFKIARYYFVTGRRELVGQDFMGSLERVEYEDAIRKLEQIQAGKLLFPSEKSDSDPGATIESVTLGSHRDTTAQTTYRDILDSF